MSRFTVSAIDPRKLSLPWHLIGAQHPGRREHIYGRIHELECKCRACREAA